MRGCGIKCWALSITAVTVFAFVDGQPYYVKTAKAASLPFAFSKDLSQASDRKPILIQHNANAFRVDDASGPAGAAIPLQIQLPFKNIPLSGADAQYTFLMFRDLPNGFKLSSGFITNDAYIASIANYNNISIIPPENYKGSFPLRVLLYRGNNIAPIERIVNISIGKDAPTENVNTSAGAKPQNNEIDEVTSLKISPESEASSLAQGEKLIESGNIVYARLIYEDLAMQGSARGAFALGQTYDSEFLKRMEVVGMQADFNTAKKWYKKAAKMGNVAAARRLNTLEKEGR
jgi:hypothetical protein